MKFRRQARDKRNAQIDEGDILQVNSDTIAVVKKIIRHGREQFPDLIVNTIEVNFLGSPGKTRRETYGPDEYRKCHRLDASLLRDDVPKYAKALEIRSQVLDGAKARKQLT